jgi:hypothetical protein
MFGTLPLKEESRVDRLLELPAEVSPGIFTELDDTLEKDEVMMG